MMYVGGCLELGEEGVDEERLVQLVVVRVVLHNLPQRVRLSSRMTQVVRLSLDTACGAQ